MKFYEICFSPTGGTKAVSDIISSVLTEKAEQISLLKCPAPIRLEKEDLCLIAVPSYAGRVPQIAKEHLLSLRAEGTKAILVSVFGNRAIDDTLIELYDIATEAGFCPVAAVEAVAEHSLARIYGAGRPDCRDQQDLVGFARKIQKLLRSGRQSFELHLPGKRPYQPSKKFPMDLDLKQNCIHCRRCAVECPVNAIDPDDVSGVDTEKCISCLHCVAVCPVHARHNSEKTTQKFEQKLAERCAVRKENKLYLPE